MKRTKLAIALSMCVLCLGMLAFAVYAAITSATFNLNGTINFNPEGVYVDVEGKVLRGSDKTNLIELDNFNYTDKNYDDSTGEVSGNFTMASWSPEVAFLPTERFIQYQITITNKSIEPITAIPSDIAAITNVTTTEEVAPVLRIDPAETKTYKLTLESTADTAITDAQVDLNLDIRTTSAYVEEQNNLGAVTFTQNADVISAVSGDNSTSNSPSLQKSLFIPKTVYGTTITGYGIDGSGITLSNAIKYVVFEADIIDIGFGAFRSESLESIGLPNSVTSIEEGTFASCSSLTSIEIPSRVTNIGYSAFNNCTNLISFTLEENSQLSSIGTSAFSGCRSLVSIKIPNSVTSIGWSTFSGCISLASIEIPSGVTSIGVDAFLGCTSLKYIRITSNLDSAYSLSGTWVRTDSAEMPSSWTTNVVTSIPATDSIGYYHQQSAWQSAS